MRPLAVALLFVLAACSSPDTTPEPTPEPADPTPTPGRYTVDEQAALLAESIDIVYCGSEPTPDWCPFLVAVEVAEDLDGWAFVRTDLTAADLTVAEGMCRDIASVTHDDEAEPIGVTDVLIFGAGNVELTDCDVVPI